MAFHFVVAEDKFRCDACEAAVPGAAVTNAEDVCRRRGHMIDCEAVTYLLGVTYSCACVNSFVPLRLAVTDDTR